MFSQPIPMRQAGEQAPAFSLQGTDGLTYQTAMRPAGPLLLVFFKRTCPSCQLAFPYAERLWQTYGPAGLAVWGVAQETKAAAQEFARDFGVTFPLLIDTGWEVSNTYGVNTVPSFFLVGDGATIEFAQTSFYKSEMNDLARLVAERLGRPVVEIAPAGDGKPAFRPG